MNGKYHKVVIVTIACITAIISLWAVAMVYSLYSQHLAQSVIVSLLAAITTAGMLIVMAAISYLPGKTAVKAAAQIMTVAYLAMIAIMSGLWVFFEADSAESITLKQISLAIESNLPFIREVGSISVAILVAVAATGIALIVFAAKNNDSKFRSEAEARAHLIGNLMKVIVSTASIGFAVSFGMSVGLPTPLAVLSGLIIDLAFITSLSKSGVTDGEEQKWWRTWTVIYGAAIAIMGLETYSELSKSSGNLPVYIFEILNSPVAIFARSLGGIFILLSIGMGIMLIVSTSIKSYEKGRATDGEFLVKFGEEKHQQAEFPKNALPRNPNFRPVQKIPDEISEFQGGNSENMHQQKIEKGHQQGENPQDGVPNIPTENMHQQNPGIWDKKSDKKGHQQAEFSEIQAENPKIRDGISEIPDGNSENMHQQDGGFSENPDFLQKIGMNPPKKRGRPKKSRPQEPA